MLSEAQRDQLARQLMTMRIITGALCAGVLFFAGIVLLIGTREAEEPVLAFVALVLSVFSVLAAAIVPRMIGKRGQSVSAISPNAQPEESSSPGSDELRRVTHAMGIYQTRLIVSLALLEAAAFLNLVAYMLEGQAVNFAVAIVLLALMLIQFPSRTRTENWVAEELHA